MDEALGFQSADAREKAGTCSCWGRFGHALFSYVFSPAHSFAAHFYFLLHVPLHWILDELPPHTGGGASKVWLSDSMNVVAMDRETGQMTTSLWLVGLALSSNGGVSHRTVMHDWLIAGLCHSHSHNEVRQNGFDCGLVGDQRIEAQSLHDSAH